MVQTSDHHRSVDVYTVRTETLDQGQHGKLDIDGRYICNTIHWHHDEKKLFLNVLLITFMCCMIQNSYILHLLKLKLIIFVAWSGKSTNILYDLQGERKLYYIDNDITSVFFLCFDKLYSDLKLQNVHHLDLSLHWISYCSSRSNLEKSIYILYIQQHINTKETKEMRNVLQ